MFVASPLQWVMDFIICNGLGIYLGMKTCEYLSMKVSWRGSDGYGNDQGGMWYVCVRCRVGYVRDGVGGRVR